MNGLREVLSPGAYLHGTRLFTLSIRDVTQNTRSNQRSLDILGPGTH